MSDLLKLVMEGMNWSKKKAQVWFNVPNPLLGMATPNGYERLKGKARLEKFIRGQLEQNKPIHSINEADMQHSEETKLKLKDWQWPDYGRGELTCPHGVGHGGIHGCDGCCSHPSFKKYKGIRLSEGYKLK